MKKQKNKSSKYRSSIVVVDEDGSGWGDDMENGEDLGTDAPFEPSTQKYHGKASGKSKFKPIGDLKESSAEVLEPPSMKEPLPAYLQTVYRDSTGRKIQPNLADKPVAVETPNDSEKDTEKEFQLGTYQKKQKITEQEMLESMSSVPFARRIDDRDLNEQWRRKTDRYEDPLALMNSGKAKHTSSTRKKDHSSYSSSKSEYVTEEQKSEMRAQLALRASSKNRFNIQPGHRWDGIDRSNGYERQWMSRVADKEAFNVKQQEVYSIDDGDDAD